MWRVQPRYRNYVFFVELGEQPRSWMREHSFADRAWFEGQVRYGQWFKDRNVSTPGCFLIYVDEGEGRKTIRIVIKIRKFSTHVLVYHAHVLSKKN